MKKLIILIVVVLLMGCEVSVVQNSGLDNMTISSKRTKDTVCIYAGCTDDYFVTLEKNEQTVELQVHGSQTYDALQIGTVVDVTYNDNFYIETIKFSDLGTPPAESKEKDDKQ